MTCPICGEELGQGLTTFTSDVNGSVVVVRDVPAQVCGSCGEAFISEEVTASLLELAREAGSSGVESVVRHYQPLG
jgi:YgiT-type zinc finger domain-containing protein